MTRNRTVAYKVPYADWNRLQFPDKDQALAQSASQVWFEVLWQELTALEKRP